MRSWVFMISILVFALLFDARYTYSSPHIDAVCVVTKIVDGDTIDVRTIYVENRFSQNIHIDRDYRVRFADINAPELSTTPGVVSKEALMSLLREGMIVYIDIDDVDVFDKYGRIVGVVYIKYNSTHLMNINKWMLDHHYAEIMDFNNEFNPYSWSLYVEVSGEDLDKLTYTTSLTYSSVTTASTRSLGNNVPLPYSFILITLALLITFSAIIFIGIRRTIS